MLCYIGSVSTNSLISFLALKRDLQLFIVRGVLFHALVASFRKVFRDVLEKPFSIRFPEETALVIIYKIKRK